MPNRSPLDPAVLTTFLKQNANWQLENNRLVRKLRFKSFSQAWDWMSKVAVQAEKLNHHPVWLNNYNRVEVELWTHDAGCITELDCQLAQEMENALPLDFSQQ